MADKFDPYRERLVMETDTIWPEEYDDWDAAEKQRVERLLHEHARQASNLQYIRTHTGFCRTITVTQEDLERVEQLAS